MSSDTKRPQIIKAPKTVSLATYLQSLAIAILVTAIGSWIGSHFFTVSMYGDARHSVIEDIKAAQESKDQQ